MSDRFEAEGITLIHADCLDERASIPADAAIISDPPYGMDWNTDNARFSGGALPRKAGHSRGKQWGSRIEGDKQPFDPSPWLGFPKVVMFGSNHFAARLPVGTTLVWVKRYDEAFGTFLSDAEVAWMKGGHGVYCFRDVAMNGGGANFPKLHPTQKTVKVMAWVMQRAKVPVGSVVVDPYMGSATTGIACMRTGRKFIGYEKDQQHFETAVERIKRELAQGVLL